MDLEREIVIAERTAVLYRQMLQIALTMWHEDRRRLAETDRQLRVLLTGSPEPIPYDDEPT